MERLYTPWRYAYVTGATKDDGCVFCGVLAADQDETNQVLHRADRWVIMLNRYPYNNGHLLLVLNRHEPMLGACTPAELAEMGTLLAAMERALHEVMQPHGFNCGYNGGSSAGAGIPEHLHLHLLPRWNGDTNFMTTVGDTRVVPQTLDQVHALVRPALSRILGSGA